MTETKTKVTLHATALQDLLKCPQLFEYRSLRRLRPKQPKRSLSLGTAMHAALAHYYRTWPDCDPKDALQVYDTTLDEIVKETQRNLGGDLPAEVWTEWQKEATTLLKSLSGYFDWAKERDHEYISEVLLVEQKFEVPVLLSDGSTLTIGPAEVYHAGTFDLVVRDPLGRIWGWDHKSVGKGFPSDAELNLDLQFGLYALAYRYCRPDDDLAGWQYNGIRKVDPARARTEVYGRKEIRKADHQLARLAERLALVYAPQAVAGPFPIHPGWGCRGCEFATVCVAAERGDDSEYLLNTLFRQTTDVTDETDDTSEE